MSPPPPALERTSQLIVIGAGYTASRLVLRAGQERPSWAIRVTGRSIERTRERLKAAPQVEVTALDLLDEAHRAAQLEALFEGISPGAWVLYSVPTLYRDFDASRRPHLEPLLASLDAAEEARVAGFIYLSSTSVYGDHGGAWISEQSERRASSTLGKMRRDLEDEMLKPERRAIEVMAIARIVGIYGPGRTLADYIRAGRYKVVGEGEKITNRVHVDDLTDAIWAIIDRAEPGHRAYNVCDGAPLAVRELLEMVNEEFDVPWPPRRELEELAAERGEHVAARWRSSYRCSNARLREELGWEPRYADALQGLRAILNEEQRFG